MTNPTPQPTRRENREIKTYLSTNLFKISTSLVIGILLLLLICGIIYHKQKMKEMWNIVEWNQDYGYSMWANFTNCANNL